MATRAREIVERELAEARGDLSRLQARGGAGTSPADERTALQRVVALQEELDQLQ